MSSTATKEESTITEDRKVKTTPYALLFELEGLAADGRGAAFRVLNSLLGEQGKAVDRVLYSRFCLDAFPGAYLPELLQALELSKQQTAKLAEDVRNGTFMELHAKADPPSPALAELLHRARERGVSIGVLSSFAEERAREIFTQLGLDAFDAQLFCFSEVEDAFPRPDCWLKVAKSLGKNPVYCGVIAGSQLAVKSALSAGMPCVATPDEFTAFQDFSGANVVLDQLGDEPVDEVLGALFPHLG